MSTSKKSRLLKELKMGMKALGMKKTKKCKLKPMTLVKYDFSSMPKEWISRLPFKKHLVYLFLGEIIKMNGHGVFIEISTGKVLCGYHMDEFIILSEEEI
jgi:hypothetical protein